MESKSKQPTSGSKSQSKSIEQKMEIMKSSDSDLAISNNTQLPLDTQPISIIAQSPPPSNFEHVFINMMESLQRSMHIVTSEIIDCKSEVASVQTDFRAHVSILGDRIDNIKSEIARDVDEFFFK